MLPTGYQPPLSVPLCSDTCCCSWQRCQLAGNPVGTLSLPPLWGELAEQQPLRRLFWDTGFPLLGLSHHSDLRAQEQTLPEQESWQGPHTDSPRCHGAELKPGTRSTTPALRHAQVGLTVS